MYNLRIISAFILLPSFITYNSFGQNAPKTQTSKSLFTNVSTIGDNVDSDIDQLLVQVRFVMSDPKNRILILDQGDFAVKVFNRDGVFVKSMGKKGGGPGEFENFGNVILDSEGHFKVSDIQKGTISTYDSDFRFVNSRASDNEPWMRAWQLTNFGDDHYISVYVSSLIESQTRRFHEFRIGSSGEIQHFGNIGPPFGEGFWQRKQVFRPGTIAKVSSDKFIYAPYLYEGELNIFERQNGVWKQSGVLKGKTINESSYRVVEADYLKNKLLKQGERGEIIHYRRSEYPGIVHSSSSMILNTSDNHLLHFSHQHKDDANFLYLEVFDDQHKLVNFVEITSIGNIDLKGKGEKINVVGINSLDEILFVDSAGEPKVYLAKVHLDKLN